MRLELVTAATTEPLTLAEAKAHLRAQDGEDALIAVLMQAAREQAEAALRRRLVTQHWRIYFDSFGPVGYRAFGGDYSARDYSARDWARDCRGLALPDVAPVAAIDSIKYIDVNGALQTLDPAVYQLVAEAPARIVLAYGQTWPDLRGDRDGVRVEVTSGYGAQAKVPAAIKAAMLLIVGHLYQNREAVMVDGRIASIVLPLGVDALLSPYIVPEF